MRPRRSLSTAALVLLAAGLAACSGDPAQVVAPAPPPLSATLEQSRDNENRHLLQVVLRNDTDTPVTVRSLQLRGGGFVQAPPTPRDDVVAPHDRTAFPVPYGEALCEGRPAPVAVVLGSTGSGSGGGGGGSGRGSGSGTVDLPVDGDVLLPALRARECALRGLRAVAAMQLTGLRRDGDAAVGELVLTRGAGPQAVQVDDAQGSVIFTLRAEGLPLVLAPGAARAAAPVRVNAARCDAHALTESKRSYDFPTYARLDGGEPLYTTVSPDPPGRALLEALLTEQCRDLR